MRLFSLLRSPSSLLVFLLLLLSATPELYAQHRSLSDGISDLAGQIAKRAAKEEGVLTIAVLPLRELGGGPTVLGTYVAEALSTHLVNAGLGIVERTLKEQLLEEQSFQETGAVDPEAAKRVGKMIGADAIVTGSVTDLKSVIAINCRVISARTGRIFAAAETQVTRDTAVEELLGQALSPARPAVPSRRAVTGATKATPQYETTFRTVTTTLDSVRVLSGNSVVATLRFLNRGSKEILVALDSNSNNVSVTDSAGNRYALKSSASIGRAHFINISRGSAGWLPCPPGAEVTATLTFSPPRNMDDRGSTFSLSIPAHFGLYFVDNWGYSRVTEDGSFQIYFRDVAPF